MAKPTPSKEIEKNILRAVVGNPLGVSISEAAESANVQRQTARKHLERLCQENTLVEYQKGVMRIFVKNTSEIIAAGHIRQDQTDCNTAQPMEAVQ